MDPPLSGPFFRRFFVDRILILAFLRCLSLEPTVWLPRLLEAMVRLCSFGWIGLVALSIMTSGCKLPNDPEDTTSRVRGERLLVGWIAGEPRSQAPEMEVIARLASRLDANIEIREASLLRLIDDLQVGRIHLIAGNLPESSPLSSEYGMSRPVGTIFLRNDETPTIIAVRTGENGFLSEVDAAIGR